MTTGLLKQGTKYALTAIFLALSAGLMVASYVLALRTLLTSEWVTLCTVILPSWAAATIGYQATRAYTDGKAIALDMARAGARLAPSTTMGSEPTIWTDDER